MLWEGLIPEAARERQNGGVGGRPHRDDVGKLPSFLSHFGPEWGTQLVEVV
jgi:hypothetical protein